jgi:hypothetical protein
MPTISGYASGEPIEAVDINQYFLRGNRNAIINGDMRVSQRFGAGSSGINDGAYGLDRWVSLGSGTGGVGSSGTVVTVTQNDDVPTGGLNSMTMTSNTANLKFGCVQIIENRNIAGIRAGTVTVSFKAKAASNITDVRCAVLGWSSTADAVTRDVVSTSGTPWLSSPPTLASGWSYLNTPVNLGVTNSWADYRVNASVTGNPNNLAVFIWVNSTAHTSFDALSITDVQLESGAIATPFERKTFQEQLADCQRYYYRTSPASGANNIFAHGYAISGEQAVFVIDLPVKSRVTFSSVEFLNVRSYRIYAANQIPSALFMWSPTPEAVSFGAGGLSHTTGSNLFIASSATGGFIAFDGAEL